MKVLKIGSILVAVGLLSGCEGQSQTERALTGALVGGLAGSATNNNVGTSAAVGALAGLASCGVAGAPACRNP